jgi:hypothetical protein
MLWAGLISKGNQNTQCWEMKVGCREQSFVFGLGALWHTCRPKTTVAPGSVIAKAGSTDVRRNWNSIDYEL